MISSECKMLGAWFCQNQREKRLSNTQVMEHLQKSGYPVSLNYVSKLRKGQMSVRKALQLADLLAWRPPGCGSPGDGDFELDPVKRVHSRKVCLATSAWLKEQLAVNNLKPREFSRMLQRHGLLYSRFDIANLKNRGLTYRQAQAFAKLMDWPLSSEEEMISRFDMDA